MTVENSCGPPASGGSNPGSAFGNYEGTDSHFRFGPNAATFSQSFEEANISSGNAAEMKVRYPALSEEFVDQTEEVFVHASFYMLA